MAQNDFAYNLKWGTGPACIGSCMTEILSEHFSKVNMLENMVAMVFIVRIFKSATQLALFNEAGFVGLSCQKQ